MQTPVDSDTHPNVIKEILYRAADAPFNEPEQEPGSYEYRQK